ncbi:zinc dependent phospholipase C family protein [Sediminibacterium sp.]|uniref:zinc dependent phospholipase C family protein n=1 Tax=Sediminibacterium sp. TaxID=1917865 RepID=UPI003F6E880F
MKGISKGVVVVLLSVFLVGLSSWGFLVHRTIHQLAVYQLPAEMAGFFHSNMPKLVYDAPRPDTRRNTDSTEAPKHFIDLEPFNEKPAYHLPHDFDKAIAKYSLDTLTKYGYVPYQIIVLKNQLTNAFKMQNKDSILFYAADLGHYIGDANVPLHTTVNYDGQLTNQQGLHSLWESMIPELEIEQYNLYSGHKVRYLRNPIKDVFRAIKRAHELLPSMFAKEVETTLAFTDSTKYRYQMRNGKQSRSYTAAFAKAYSEKLRPTINQQLLHSADMIANFWYTAWIDAGKPDLSGITNWSDEKQAQYASELEAYNANELIKRNLLEARKK